jgi:hypothetical protein
MGLHQIEKNTITKIMQEMTEQEKNTLQTILQSTKYYYPAYIKNSKNSAPKRQMDVTGEHPLK